MAMAKSKSRPVSSHRGIELPDFSYDVRSTFVPIELRDAKYGKQAKGVLDLCNIRPATHIAKGDIKLRFLSSLTIPTHSDLIDAAGLDGQPIMDVNFKGVPYRIAARYTVRPGRKGPIETTVMLDSPEGDVRSQRGYEVVRHASSLAIASAVFGETREAEINSTEMELTVSNNFASGGLPQFENFNAANIIELARKLTPSP